MRPTKLTILGLALFGFGLLGLGDSRQGWAKSAASSHEEGWVQITRSIDESMSPAWRSEASSLKASDDAFFRRVTIDLIGRVPTLEEWQNYAKLGPERRKAWVDQLLASPEYVAYWSDLLTDLFLGRDVRFMPREMAPRREFFARALSADTPWNQLTQTMLTAQGSVPGDGSSGFLIFQKRRGGIPEMAGQTARFFLGQSIACAQCHDHPFDETIKQKDFIEFAASFGDFRVQNKGEKIIQDIPTSAEAFTRERFQNAMEKKPDLKFAGVNPRFFFSQKAYTPGGTTTRREWLASEVLASEFFPKAIVNRMWSWMIGKSLGRAIDDVAACSNGREAVLKALSASFKNSGMSQRQLLKGIVLSQIYGLSAGKTTADTCSEDLPRPSLRMMSADQLFRSLRAATKGTAEGVFSQELGSVMQIALRQFLFRVGDDATDVSESFSGTLPQILLLISKPLSGRKNANDSSVLSDVLAKTKDFGQRTDLLTKVAYGRAPSEKERQWFNQYFADSGLPGGTAENAGKEMAAWRGFYDSLLSSTEFVTNH